VIEKTENPDNENNKINENLQNENFQLKEYIRNIDKKLDFIIKENKELKSFIQTKTEDYENNLSNILSRINEKNKMKESFGNSNENKEINLIEDNNSKSKHLFEKIDSSNHTVQSEYSVEYFSKENFFAPSNNNNYNNLNAMEINNIDEEKISLKIQNKIKEKEHKINENLGFSFPINFKEYSFKEPIINLHKDPNNSHNNQRNLNNLKKI